MFTSFGIKSKAEVNVIRHKVMACKIIKILFFETELCEVPGSVTVVALGVP